jgi:hypothetical protein
MISGRVFVDLTRLMFRLRLAGSIRSTMGRDVVGRPDRTVSLKLVVNAIVRLTPHAFGKGLETLHRLSTIFAL